jgi:hypothetical protein
MNTSQTSAKRYKIEKTLTRTILFLTTFSPNPSINVDPNLGNRLAIRLDIIQEPIRQHRIPAHHFATFE